MFTADRTFDSFKDQADLQEWVLKREATAVSGALEGFAQAVEGKEDQQVMESADVARWLRNSAELVKAVFGLAE